MKELIAHTKIFDVVLKDEVMPGFRPIGIDAPDWVMVVAERDGKFLMTRQLRYGLMKVVEEFVCGTVDADERPVETAQRELREETGVVIPAEALVPLGEIAPNPAFMSNLMHVFYVNLDETPFQLVAAAPGEHEKLSSQWVDKLEVIQSVDHPREGVVRPAMKTCAVHLYLNR